MMLFNKLFCSAGHDEGSVFELCEGASKSWMILFNFGRRCGAGFPFDYWFIKFAPMLEAALDSDEGP